MVDFYCIFYAENDAVDRFSLSPHIVENRILIDVPFDYIEIRTQRCRFIIIIIQKNFHNFSP